jgi:hypothetical protein
MEQQQFWSIRRTGFAIRNLEAANICGAIADTVHFGTPSKSFLSDLYSVAQTLSIVAPRKGRAIAELSADGPSTAPNGLHRSLVANLQKFVRRVRDVTQNLSLPKT